MREGLRIAILGSSLLASLVTGGDGLAASPPEYSLEPVGDHLWLRAPDGRLLLDLLPTLRVAYAAAPVQPRAISRMRVKEHRFTGPYRVPRGSGSFKLEAELQLDAARYTLRLEGQGSLLKVVLEAAYTRALAVRIESLRFATGPLEGAEVVDRDYRWRPVRAPHFLDGLGPRIVRLRGTRARLEVVGGKGVQGLWIRPRADRSCELEVELEHEANHPFLPHVACVKRPWARVARRPLDVQPRRAGSRVTLEASILLGAFMTPLVGRYPRGYQAAVVLTDHADPSDASKLEALAFGATGALAKGSIGPPHAGLVNRGLAYTKSLFVEQVSGYSPQLEDPAYRVVLDALTRRGTELALHSITGGPDRPDVVRRHLGAFLLAHHTRTWIDHQPVTNCEALTNRGWDPSSPWYLLPALDKAGLRYFWSAQDLPLSLGSLNLLEPQRTASRHPVIYRHGVLETREGQEAFLFATARLYEDRRRLLKRFTSSALDRFVKERGLLIGHVYLDAFHLRGRFAGRSLLARQSAGGFVLRPEIDELFARLSQRQAEGQIWVAGLEAVAGHLLEAMAVEVMPGADGRSASVVARGRLPLYGVTLLLPGVQGRAVMDGKPPAGERRGNEEWSIWFDLEAPGSTGLEIEPDGPLLVRSRAR